MGSSIGLPTPTPYLYIPAKGHSKHKKKLCTSNLQAPSEKAHQHLLGFYVQGKRGTVDFHTFSQLMANRS